MKFSKPARSMQYFVLVVAAYALLALLLPISETTTDPNLSLASSKLFALVATLPLFFTWFVAFWCLGALQKYSNAIHTATDGKSFRTITLGVGVLTWGLVVPAFFALAASTISANNPTLQKAAIITQNYISLLFPLIGFSLIGLGTRLLLLKTKRNYASLPASRILLLLFASLGAVYSYFVLHLREEHIESFYLPTALLIATLIIPYLFAWFAGLVAAYDISLVARVTKGIIYRRGLNWLSVGLVTVIVMSILLQYLNSLIISGNVDFPLKALVLIDYLLLTGVASGYCMMIAGVQKLQQIEDV